MIRAGSWWLKSESDPRWNAHGSDNYCGGFVMPKECEKKIKELKEKLSLLPVDLGYGYMKD